MKLSKAGLPVYKATLSETDEQKRLLPIREAPQSSLCRVLALSSPDWARHAYEEIFLGGFSSFVN
jgi:hypothetical protein